MNYRLSIAQPLRDSIPAIASCELESAIERLASGSCDHTMIHEVRRSFKKVRALLGLVEPVSRGPAARAGRKRISVTAQKLSTTRDAYAAIKAAATLEKDLGEGQQMRVFSDLQSFLEARRDRAEESLRLSDAADLVRPLEKTKASLAKLDVKGASVLTLIGPAAMTYRRGRRAMRKAAEDGSGEALHEWRKEVQRHWRHMLLLREAWPKEGKARIACAQRLSDELGSHRDLGILRDTILGSRIVFRSPHDVKMLCATIAKRQAALETKVFVLGSRLYGQKPKAFEKDLRAQWKSASAPRVKS